MGVGFVRCCGEPLPSSSAVDRIFSRPGQRPLLARIFMRAFFAAFIHSSRSRTTLHTSFIPTKYHKFTISKFYTNSPPKHIVYLYCVTFSITSRYFYLPSPLLINWAFTSFHISTTTMLDSQLNFTQPEWPKN